MLNEKIKKLEEENLNDKRLHLDELASIKSAHSRELERIKQDQSQMNIVRSEPTPIVTPKPHSNTTEEVDTLRRQLAVERKEKSRLEADNSILVEKLRTGIKRVLDMWLDQY